MLLPRGDDAGGDRAVGGARAAFSPWPAVLATWGPGGRSALHAHHCWHLVVALEGELEVRRSVRGAAARTAALLTRPDVPHALDASARPVVIVFVDPESELGDRLGGAGGDELRLLDDRVAERLRRLLAPGAGAPGNAAPALAEALALVGAAAPPAAPRHPGVRRVLRHLGAAPPEAETSLAALAAVAGLSPGRFMHAFTKSVGLPLRPYLRWRKLQWAGRAIAAGAPLAAAAAEAGFADAAHMSRTFRRMFGVTPSELRREALAGAGARSR
jgi:AraC-like DNA-binding protein